MAGTRFRGTIIFACFDGEELGLWGSDHYARELAARHAPVLAVLNNDIIGNSVGGDGLSEPGRDSRLQQALPAGADIERVNLVGSENDSPSRELSRFIAETVPVYVPDFTVRQIFRSDRFLRGGDQESFQDAGYCRAVRFVEPHENFTHQHQDVRVQDGVQYGDLPQYMDSEYLRRATQANVAALADAGAGPGTAGRRRRWCSRHLGYDSTLRWKPRGRRRLLRDRLARDRCAAMARGSKRRRRVEATVPISKDDYILGVRSVDANGLRSPAVYPVPHARVVRPNRAQHRFEPRALGERLRTTAGFAT